MVREQGDCNRGEEDEADGEQRDGTKVGSEIAPRSEQRRRKQEWWQEKKKNQFRIEPDFRQFGNQTEQQSADHEQDGIRDVQLAGQQRQNCHGKQQSHKNLNHTRHARRAYG